MIFTNQDLRLRLSQLGIPSILWQLADDTYETVSDDHVRKVWEAWIDSLRDNAPSLLVAREIGGGKTIAVPKWQPESGDCDDHAILMMAHAITGNWLAGNKNAKALGVVFYTAEPRAENKNRSGRHATVWYIDDAGIFKTFEPADGDIEPFVQSEIMSATFGLAA